MNRATGKTALVTGGAKGIGKEIVKKLCEDGFNVAFCYNKSKDLALHLSAELNSYGQKTMAIACDVSKSHEVLQMFNQVQKSFGNISVLVNNAGIAQQKLFTDISDEDWQEMMGSNLSAAFYCCREAAKEMIRQKSGKIINISSVWGVSGASCEVHYSAAKAGLIGLTKALAKELAPSGINVNCIAPGVIQTDMLSSFSDEDIAMLKSEIPIGRIGRPQDIAGLVSFLASDAAEYISSQVICVDGGFI